MQGHRKKPCREGRLILSSTQVGSTLVGRAQRSAKCGTSVGLFFGYVWLVSLGIALLFSSYTAYKQSIQVREYAIGADRFGYLMMAKEVREAVSHLQPPQFHLESQQTRLLIDLMLFRNVPLPLWAEMVAPHAYHYFPRAGNVGVQYPPGTGLVLAAFPQGDAVARLNKAVVGLLLSFGIVSLVLAGQQRAWISAGFLILAACLGLDIIGQIDSMSHSINAVLGPLLLAFVLVFISLRFAKRVAVAWILLLWLDFVGGLRSWSGCLWLCCSPELLCFFGPIHGRCLCGTRLFRWAWCAAYGYCSAVCFPTCSCRRMVPTTYTPADNSAPSLVVLSRNIRYYLGSARGARLTVSRVVCSRPCRLYVLYPQGRAETHGPDLEAFVIVCDGALGTSNRVFPYP